MAGATATNGNGGGKQDALRTLLESDGAKKRLAEVARSVVGANDLVRLALMAKSRQPDLAKCAPHSVLRALMDAAELGIKPGGKMGRGYLVPRKNNRTGDLECHFDPGWRGLIDVARRGGKIQSIEAHVVFEGDVFSVAYGMYSDLIHRPMLVGDPGEVIAAYAVATFKDGAKQAEVLTRREIDKIRATSMAKSGPWVNWFDEMARKSAVRRLCKYLPFDEALERALDQASDGDEDDVAAEDVAPSRAKGIASKIRAKSNQGNADIPDIDLDIPGDETGAIDTEGETVDPETGVVT